MAYTTVTEVWGISVYKDGIADAAGKTAQAIATADLRIKSRIKAAGLTPPTSDDILKGASQVMARGILRRTKREEGSLPGQSQGGNPDTYDATNRAVDFDIKFGLEMVDEYIKYAQTNVQPYDTDGQPRADGLAGNMKLDQNAMPTFTES